MPIHFDKEIEPIMDTAGKPYPDCLIIDRPDLKSRPLLFGEGVLTILFWGFWFYLWLPLVSLMAWIFGFKFLYRQMIELGGFAGFIQQLNIFSSGIALVSGAIAIWSFYNYKRYGSYNRRNKLLKTNTEQLAATLNVSTKRLSEIQQAKRIVFSFTDDDSIDKINLSSVPQSQETAQSCTHIPKM